MDLRGVAKSVRKEQGDDRRPYQEIEKEEKWP
jgi:hypothetical protein